MHWILAVLLAAGAGLTPPDTDPPVIEHTPVKTAARGQPVEIGAQISDPSGVFGAQVVARTIGGRRFSAFPMDDRGDGNYAAVLPATMLTGGGLEYFIEAFDEQGNGPARAGSPERPLKVQAMDAPPQPAKLLVRTDPPEAEVLIDGALVAQAASPQTIAAGTHTVTVRAAGRRPSESRLELQAGKEIDLLVTLAEGRGAGVLRVRSDPSGAQVFLDGALLGTTPFAGALVPGKHVLSVQSQGHLTEEREVVFEEGHDVEESYSLPVLPRGAALAVDSVPSGALLVIDGLDKGRTPWVGPLAAGPHNAVLRLPGHRETASDFDMPANRDLSLKLELPEQKAPRAPRLSLTSTPSEAEVLLDDKRVGLTPYTAEVAPGPHVLKIALKGYVAQQKKIMVVAERDVETSVVLERVPGPATLTVETDPAGASIAIDGKDAGVSPLTVELAAGDHLLSAIAIGRRGVDQQLTVEAGQKASLRLTLPETRGPIEPQVQINTQPQGAQVMLDGKPAGETPFKDKVGPGPHELKLTLGGYLARTANFKIPENRDVQLVFAVQLKPTRESEAQKAATPEEVARARYKAAHACFKQGDYACALSGYQASYELKPVPELLFNIGQTRRRLGQHKEAALAFRSVTKDAQGTLLAKEAERLAIASEQAAQAQAAGAAPVKAPDEDTTPPTIAHEPVTRTMRGAPMILSATIKDDRSGVYDPRACVRNIFATEWVCLPMQAQRGDQYTVEVPARFTTDGLAYYLEAFDNAGNGPARAGSPEQPFALSLEEKPKEAVAAAPKTAAPGEALVQTSPRTGASVGAWVGVGVGGAMLIGGLVLALRAHSLDGSDTTTTSNGITFHSVSAADAQSASDLRAGSLLLFGVGGALVVSGGATLFLLPHGAGVAGEF